MGILLIVITFFVTLILGIPIVASLGLSGILYILVNDQHSMFLNLPQRMFVAIDNFTFLAIPFFILVGELMNTGGITARLIQLSRSLVGHLSGGLAYVNVVVSGFLSSIIGSSQAVAAITSRSIVPEMRKDGFSNEYASAVTAAASLLGPIIPPSLMFILYGATAGASIAALFLAGIIPGFILILVFCFIAYFYAKKHNFPKKEKGNWKSILRSIRGASLALTIPLIIIGGITYGFFTATEAGAIGCLVAFLLGMFVYREIKWRDIPTIMLNAAKTSSIILIIASTANFFSWLLAMESVGNLVASVFTSISNDPIIVLLVINIVLLIVGLFLDPLACIFIFTPILLPLITELGIDPVHFGIIMCLNLVLGMITPPVGLTLFVVQGITKVSIERLTIALIPYIAITFLIILILTFVPQVSTFLPNLLLK